MTKNSNVNQTIKAYNFFNISQQQPEVSADKNCTAALTNHNFGRFYWIVVACDKTFNATYICQSNTQFNTAPGLLPISRRCGDGWVQFDKAHKCLLVLWTNEPLSFHDVEQVCFQEGAEVFNVQATPRSHETPTSTSLKTSLLEAYLYLYKKKPPNIMKNISGYHLQNLLFGSALRMDVYTKLLQILRWARPDIAENITVFVHVNMVKEECNLLRFTILNYLYNHDPVNNFYTRGWGVKCRSCYEYINVSAVICQKTSATYISRCEINHFKCHDKTCILSLYKCDFINDCLDSSDEYLCDYNITYLSLIQYIRLPCLLNGDCNKGIEHMMPVHSVCDGIYSNTSLLHEDVACRLRGFEHMNLTILYDNWSIDSSKQILQDIALVFMYLQEKSKNCQNSNIPGRIYNSTVNMMFLVSHFKSTHCQNLANSCEIRYDEDRCVTGNIDVVCESLACPGMFKCQKFYCISISAVCDGQYDCLHGQDEQLCSEFICPGFLKCRGERRCVGTEQICDNHLDCVYSIDDEIGCHPCPYNCTCEGYVLLCDIYNSLELAKDDIPHIKGLILRGVRKKLFLYQLCFSNLVYIKLSFCGIEKVILSIDKIKKNYPNLLIVDFSNNLILQIRFLRTNIFTNVVYLDLSSNLLTTFRMGFDLLLNYLSVLILSGNVLNVIILYSTEGKIRHFDLDIRNIYQTSNFVVSVSSRLKIRVSVSEAALCCYFSDDVECICQAGKEPCFGILRDMNVKAILYTVSVISLFLSLLLIIKFVVAFSWRRNTPRRIKTLFIALVNLALSLFIASIYFGGLSIADVMKVNVIFWKKGNMCILLRLFLYFSYELNLTFKIALACISCLQIIFPFKHQCIWLKWTSLVALFIWLAFLFFYIIDLIMSFMNTDTIVLDTLCSLRWCEMKAKDNFLQLLAFIIDLMLIGILMLSVTKAHFALNESLKLHSTNRFSACSIILKLIAPTITEVVLRTIVFITFAINYLDKLSLYYCSYSLLLLLALNTILSTLFYICRR